MWIPAAGGVAGIVVFMGALVGNEPFSRAALEGLAAAFLAMIVCGVATRFAQGAEVDEASAGTAAVKFAEAAESPLRELNERVDEQVAELEQRVYELESESADNADRTGDGQAEEPSENQ